MDTCLKSTQKQTESATAREASISEEKPRVYDGSNLCLELVKVETIENAQFEASGTDFTEALDQLNARPKEEQVTGIDDLLSTLKESLNYLAGLESLTEGKEKPNPSQNEVSEPPDIDKVTSQNNCFSESTEHIDEKKISSEKSLGLKTCAKDTEIAACSNRQSRSAQKNALYDTCVNSVSERSGLVSDINAESNELNEIAIELLNLLAEDEPTEKPTESNDALETLQVALESLSGQQSVEQERSNEGSSLTLKEEDAGRGSKALPPGLPTSVSAEFNDIIGNEHLRTESRADNTSVTDNDVAINSTDVSRDSVRRSSRLNSAIQIQDTCRGNTVTHNIRKVGLHTRNYLMLWEISKKHLGNSSQTVMSNRVNGTVIDDAYEPCTSLLSQPRESNRTLSEETLVAGQNVTPKDSGLDDIQVIRDVSRSTTERESDKLNVCSLCGAGFSRRESWGLHMNRVHNIKAFACNRCDKRFSGNCSLRRHVREVHVNLGRKDIRCEICGKWFANVECLRIHNKFVHEKSKNMATCPKCGKELLKCNLKQHLLTHAVERVHSCSVCNKKYTTKHNLALHVRTHDETRIPCEKCGSRVKKYAFNNHMRNHGHSFQCEICGEKLSNCTTFKLHKSTHTGEQPFVCEQCGRKFARQYNLHTHLKLHAGIRKLVCDLCKRTFAQKWNLRTHMESCQKAFLSVVTR